MLTQLEAQQLLQILDKTSVTGVANAQALVGLSIKLTAIAQGLEPSGDDIQADTE